MNVAEPNRGAIDIGETKIMMLRAGAAARGALRTIAAPKPVCAHQWARGLVLQSYAPRTMGLVPVPRGRMGVAARPKSTNARKACLANANTGQPEASETSTIIPSMDMGVDPTSGREPKSGMQKLADEVTSLGSAFGGVPPQALAIGIAGLVPYVFTSVSTLYLSWNISRGARAAAAAEMDVPSGVAGSGWLDALEIAPQTAEHLLSVLQPIHVGYGACILSFLGAVHWGLELAQYGGQLGMRRYFLGVLAPLLAWPTVMLPTDTALIVQFIGFVGMYFADAQAAANGWAPSWYHQYRFILTFVVGTCILFTLIIKGWIGEGQMMKEISYAATVSENQSGSMNSSGHRRIQANMHLFNEDDKTAIVYKDRVHAELELEQRRLALLQDALEANKRKEQEGKKDEGEEQENRAQAEKETDKDDDDDDDDSE